jgi:hypothetical protein
MSSRHPLSARSAHFPQPLRSLGDHVYPPRVHEPDNPALGASSSQRQVPARTGCNVQSVHPRLDKLLRPILSHAVASDSDEDRCLCHPLGASQIQAAPTSDQRRQRLVCPATPRHSNALRPLAAMLRQRPNIGSRVNREVHARFWERAEVKFLRTTRYQRRFERAPGSSALPPISDVLLCRGK